MAKKAKKTITISAVRDRANHFLAEHPGNEVHHKGQRRGVAHLLETILLDTGNYRGFRYLKTMDDPDFDDSRRHYF